MKRIALVIIMMTLLALAGTAQASGAEQTIGCAQPARLYVGGGGRVTLYPSLPNNLRQQPSFSGAVIGQIPAGASFYVVGGPQCGAGILWWQVSYNGRIGWTAEGDGWGTYFLEPAGIVPPPTPYPIGCALPNRLVAGGYGRVTPGLPNVVRTAPGTTASGAVSQVIGQISGGGIFQVLGGPQCGPDGRWWWYVNYQNLIGWTAEGEGYNQYWLEPYSGDSLPTCPGGLPSRLNPGGYGRVTTYPNLPNRIRTAPGFGNAVLGWIPAGAVFYVISGPDCADGTAWFRVTYNGITGWTAESGNALYWLEPA